MLRNMSAKALARGDDMRMTIIRSSSGEGSSDEEDDDEDDDRDDDGSDVDIVGDPPTAYRS